MLLPWISRSWASLVRRCVNRLLKLRLTVSRDVFVFLMLSNSSKFCLLVRSSVACSSPSRCRSFQACCSWFCQLLLLPRRPSIISERVFFHRYIYVSHQYWTNISLLEGKTHATRRSIHLPDDLLYSLRCSMGIDGFLEEVPVCLFQRAFPCLHILLLCRGESQCRLAPGLEAGGFGDGFCGLLTLLAPLEYNERR